MTNNELLELKVLADNSHLFGCQQDSLLTNEQRNKYLENNRVFFKKCIDYIPDLVDELIDLRRWVEDCTCCLDDYDERI